MNHKQGVERAHPSGLVLRSGRTQLKGYVMLAVKAKYDNGMVQWPNTPPVNGLHELIVIFQDIPEPVTEVVRSSGMSQASELDQAIAISQSLYSDIPQSVSLADELIAERRREALNE